MLFVVLEMAPILYGMLRENNLNWLEEVLLVLAYSTRTQVAILMGVVSSIGMLIYGYNTVESFELTGMLAPLTGVLKPYFSHRYEAAALSSLLSFLGLALKLYRKDYKRIMGRW